MRSGADLTLSGNVVFSGTSAVGGASGGADAGKGTGAGPDIFMMSGGQLTFDLQSNLEMNGPIVSEQGALLGGGLTKRGAGILHLTGDNTYTGTTTIEAGLCRISGSVITDTTVDATGSLTGNFTLKSGRDLDNSGRVEPGSNGNGAITFEGGTYTHEASATLVIDITPDGVDFNKLFFTSGDAVLNGGDLQVILSPGNYISGTTYEIINAPTTGTFTNVIKTGSFADTIEIDIAYSSVILTVLNSQIHTHQNITAQPAKAVEKCIVSADIVPGSDFATMVEILGTLNDSQVNTALTGLSPARFGALEWINERNNSYVASLLRDRDPCHCGSLWLTGFANKMKNTKAYTYLRPFSADAFGVLLGGDGCCGDLSYGAAFGYTYTDLDWRKKGGDGDLHTYTGALYGDYRCGWLCLNLALLGGGTSNHLDRRITFSTVDRKAKSNPWSYFVTTHLEAEGCISCFRPFVLVDYHYYRRNSFKEKGAQSLDLNVQSKTQHMLRLETGANAAWTLDACGYTVCPYIGVSYVGEYPLHTAREKASFTGRSCVINAISYDQLIHLGSPALGVTWAFCDWILEAQYKGLFNNRTRINEASASINWQF
jgi:outer membrane autotransporter protein